MVIPVVRQEDAGSTQGITDNCPEWGIYREGFRGISHPPNQILKNAWRFTYLANSICTSFGNRVDGRKLLMTDKEKTKEGIAYRTKRTIDRTKEEFYHPLVG